MTQHSQNGQDTRDAGQAKIYEELIEQIHRLRNNIDDRLTTKPNYNHLGSLQHIWSELENLNRWMENATENPNYIDENGWIRDQQTRELADLTDAPSNYDCPAE